jgi:hypothetical protein
MKETENNEIDALLRNLARRGRGLSTALNTAPDITTNVVHLDADELSAYAEHALPPSARARCNTHLADCDDCRKVVVQLSLAAGPLPVEPHVNETPIATPGWMQKLSALLSPRIVRYALPALGLVIIGVAFFGLRQQQRKASLGDYVALKQDHAAAPAPDSASAGTYRATSGRVDSANDKGRSQTVTEPKAVASAPEATPVAVDSVAGKEEKKASGEGDNTREAPKVAKADADKTAKTEEKPADAAQPATARAEPPPPASKARRLTETTKDLARNNVADDRERGRDNNVNVPRKGPARNENEVASQTQRGPAKGQAHTQSASKMKAAEDDAAGASRGQSDEAETRTVFGRQFRRVGNAWVDTAYKSSMTIRSLPEAQSRIKPWLNGRPLPVSPTVWWRSDHRLEGTYLSHQLSFAFLTLRPQPTESVQLAAFHLRSAVPFKC